MNERKTKQSHTISELKTNWWVGIFVRNDVKQTHVFLLFLLYLSLVQPPPCLVHP